MKTTFCWALAALAFSFSAPLIAACQYQVDQKGPLYSSYDAACSAAGGKYGRKNQFFGGWNTKRGCYFLPPVASWAHSVSKFGCGGCIDLNDDGLCDSESGEDDGKPKHCDATGNPIHRLYGNKYQEEVDFETYSNSPLRIARHYNSRSTEDGSFGKSWSGQHHLSLSLLSPFRIRINMADGKKLFFLRANTGNDWTPRQPLANDRLEVIDSEYHLFDEKKSSYIFDINGQLIRMETPNNEVFSYQYADNLLIQVNDSYGESVQFEYDANGRIIKAIDPAGGVYQYAYDLVGRLQYVSYPDATNGASGANPFSEDNPYKEYLYENTTFPTALTGIKDENSIRYATWGYDDQGRAVSSEHANGIDNFTLDYSEVNSEEDPRITETNALGKMTTYHISEVHGRRFVNSVEGHASQNCLASNKQTSYDGKGFYGKGGYPDEVTDWQGNITDYDYSDTGLEVRRIEAKGTPHQRVYVTEWDEINRLKLSETLEGAYKTTYQYNADRTLKEKSTVDISGQ